MYAKKLWAYDFRCFGKATMDLQFPGRRSKGASETPNVNLILGDNGGGKSSVLRAIAIAVLAPVLLETGFVPYRMVRRPDAKRSLIKLTASVDVTEYGELKGEKASRSDLTLLARFDMRQKSSRDRLHLESTPDSPITKLIYDDYSSAFFLVGYGATRRVETSDYIESSSRRQRGLRYQRVAGLFEDHVAVRPLQAWFPKLEGTQRGQALRMLATVLPENLRFDGEFDSQESQFIFTFNDVPTPFSALSDGYKAFVGMAGDLIGHLADVCPPGGRLDAISGIVLIDEIDLHLHPEWQRTILPALARAFPKLQFVCTTHSPLVASTVRKENVFITDTAVDGTATIKQIEERVFGQSAEQLLLSSYFGLTTTRGEQAVNEADTLLANAVAGDRRAALSLLKRLSAPTTPTTPTAPRARRGPKRKVSSPRSPRSTSSAS